MPERQVQDCQGLGHRLERLLLQSRLPKAHKQPVAPKKLVTSPTSSTLAVAIGR